MADAMFGFCKSNSDIPIARLDYSYIGKCNDAKELESLLKILRSGEEGHFPDLVNFTEERLKRINPNSKLLQKETKVKTMNELKKDESSLLIDDLAEWSKRMATVDETLLASHDQVQNNIAYPPIRQLSKEEQHGRPKDVAELKFSSNKRAAPRTYNEWERVDVESEVKRVDEVVNEKPSERTRIHNQTNSIPTKILQDLPEEERIIKANLEKEKGNEAFRAGDFAESLIYYSRSISLHESAAVYNNRAITYIKIEKFEDAIIECNTVLKLEPKNVKAFLRRGIALKSLKRYEKAIKDFSKVLELAPNNKRAYELFQEMKKVLNQSEMGAIEKETIVEQNEIGKMDAESGTRRMVIEESDGDEKKEKRLHEKPVKEAKKKGKRLKIVEVESDDDISSNKPEDDQNNTGKIEETERQISLKNDENTFNSDLIINGNGLLNEVSENEAASKKSPHASRNQINTNAAENGEGIETSESDVVDVKEDGRSDIRFIAEARDTIRNSSEANLQKKEQMMSVVPDEVVQIKNEGNDFYKAGRYAEAEVKYSMAIDKLKKAGKGHDLSIAILLTNRATCKLKIGDCKGCVKDATESLGMRATAKAFLRRAASYEHIENYRQAYADNQSALRIDHTLQAAWSASERLLRILKNRDGSNWRQHLPINEYHLNTMQQNFGNFADKLTDERSSRAGQKDIVKTESILETKEKRGEREGKGDERRCDENSEVLQTDNKGNAERMEEEFKKMKEAGNKHVQQKEYQAAIDCYTNCMALFPNEVACHTNRALCYLRIEQYENAENDASKALEIQSDNVKALFRRALARKSLGKYENAVEDLNSLLKIDVSNSAARKEVETIRKLTIPQSSRKYADQDSHARRSGSMEKTEVNSKEAEKDSNGLGTSNIDYVTRSRKDGGNDIKRDDWLDGNRKELKRKGKKLRIMEVDEAEDMERTDTILHENCKENGEETLKYDMNRKKAETEIDIANKNDVKFKKNENPKKKGEESKEKRFNRIRELGKQCLQKESFHDAMYHFSQCIDFFPNEAVPYIHRAFCYLKLNKLKKAETDCAKALALQPNNSEALFHRALVRKSSGKFKDALQDLTGLIKLDSQNVAVKSEIEVIKEMWRVELKSMSSKQPEKSKTSEGSSAVSQQRPRPKKSQKSAEAAATTRADMSATSRNIQTSTNEQSKQTAKESFSRSPKKLNLKKASGFEFLKAWNELNGRSLEEYAELLNQIEPSQLPRIISNKIDVEMIQTIVSCVYEHFFTKEKILFGFNVLKYTSKAERFNMGIMFLSTNDLSKIRRVVIELERKLKDVNVKVAQKELTELRKAYKAT